MKKIVLACFWVRESNCGDKLYVETFKKLIEEYTENVQVEICDFYARKPKTSESETALTVSETVKNANVGTLVKIKRKIIKK